MARILPILTEGDPRLAQRSAEVAFPDPTLAGGIADLHATLAAFRERHGYGRAMAAPQAGILRRLIVVNLGATPFALVNPEITWRSDETFEVWDDCLSVPDCVVRVRRHRHIALRYQDESGRVREWPDLPPDLSELLQHEIDHLDGVLLRERAVDGAAVRPIAEHADLVGAARPSHRLSLDGIRRALDEIPPPFRDSPQYECEPLSAALGCRLLLKVESVNPIRSFKGRGACAFVARHVAAGGGALIACASAGNFGQGLAWAARAHGLRLVVFASVHANPLKVARMRGFGAEVRLAGEDFDAAKDAARAFAAVHGARFVEDGAEAAVSEGAGTIAIELLARGDALDDLLVPLGNGALLNGIARWTKAASPATRTIGVVARGAPAMQQSFASGRAVATASARTMADGIAVRVPVPEAVADMQGLVDAVRAVDEDRLAEAMVLLRREAGLLVEPAGAAGVAAILAERARVAGRRVATVLCGGNVAPDAA
jgi:peptide deformylase